MFVSSPKNISWSDEQTRFFLQLRLDENQKGNVRKGSVNDAGRQTIIEKFYEAFGEKLPWKKFGIKFTHCKKLYDSCKRLTHNRTGLGYHQDGSIDMIDDWWNQRCQVYTLFSLDDSFKLSTCRVLHLLMFSYFLLFGFVLIHLRSGLELESIRINQC